MDAGFCKTSGSWDCPSSLARVSPPQPNDSRQQSAQQARILPAPSARQQQRGITLLDDNTDLNSDSATAVVTEAEPTAAEPTSTGQDTPVAASAAMAASGNETRHPAPAADDKHASEDFASALENFTTETEEAVGEDRVIKGTVLKLTATHVVVDIGTKSEGMLPLSEVLDHEGKPKVKPGDEIEVMREKGQTEEGYVNLSHQKAARIHAWAEFE